MSGEPICIGGIKGKDQEMAEMQARIAELESALHLALAVAPDDPILTTAAEKQVVELRERITALEAERDGYRNGQEQMQHINSGLMDANAKWAEENKRLRDALDGLSSVAGLLIKEGSVIGPMSLQGWVNEARAALKEGSNGRRCK